ncbi:Nucleotide-binding universal stress protein, UspA family [Luteibacter sp. UNCMF331Sha3.1]|uniref:universal stress protein n=1 Tax=Luteibacter sp. UNCMF331Sha3.1 TaxID=1502760 RepID=UPI0008CF4757|nr:universal stress protein [Luteibacter sp. UNCMF331Sha3.1]SEN19660.1 Nucleotide-binding universal stress protein, UspA family [Luteibacter sp. UNCMF331Sha3.1]
MFSHILLAIDTPEGMANAARLAIDLAARLGATLSVLHVVTDDVAVPAVSAEARATAPPNIEFDALRDMARASGVACGCERVSDGTPARAIDAYAVANGCDLIVLGTHERGGLKRAILGSQVDKLLRRSHVPVLVCPQQGDFAIHRVLVLVDDSDASRHAVDVCMELASILGSHVYALLVLSPLPSVNLLADYLQGNIHFRHLTGRAERLLEGIRAQAKSAGVAVSTEYTFDRRPDTVVTARACTHRCDLVVLPRHGHAPHHTLFHDLTELCAMAAETPVLVCPQPVDQPVA